MKRNTIKWKIYKYNLVVIIMLITLTTIIFNIAVHMYIEKDILGQLSKIASNIEETALRQGPKILPGKLPLPPIPPPFPPFPDMQHDNDLLRFCFMLDRSLRESLTVLNADYLLLDKDKNIVTPFPSAELVKQIISEIGVTNLSNESYFKFHFLGTEHIAILKPVSQKNPFGLRWIIIYSSLQKISQLQLGINIILCIILIVSAVIISIFSTHISKKISATFSNLNQYIRAIAERNFGTKIHMPVEDELQDLVHNINIMTGKLETYDKAQKTFLQNVSHEFRTPLMSIRSYAEGIKYDVIDPNTAVNIIIDETKRMTHLVEDLLYLSRLDTIKENYDFESLDFNELIKTCIERMNGVAIKNGKKIVFNNLKEKIEIYADEEKLSRAITNIISNCIRYADNTIKIILKTTEHDKVKIIILDDGPGFESNELPFVFERFYKGRKGNFGLGLAISKNVIQRHNGEIIAANSVSGAIFIIMLPISGPRTSNIKHRSHA